MQVNFLCLLKEKLRVAENGQVKNCMLIFDEMSIEEKCEFDVQVILLLQLAAMPLETRKLV